jgi:hypothetical protein
MVSCIRWWFTAQSVTVARIVRRSDRLNHHLQHSLPQDHEPIHHVYDPARFYHGLSIQLSEAHRTPESNQYESTDSAIDVDLRDPMGSSFWNHRMRQCSPRPR